MARASSSTAIIVAVVLVAGLGAWFLQADTSENRPDDRLVKQSAEVLTPLAAAAPAAAEDVVVRPTTPADAKPAPKIVQPGVDAATPEESSATEIATSVEKPAPKPANGGFRPVVPEGAELPDPIPSSVDNIDAVVLESGVKYWDIKVGEGPPPDEDGMIIVSYRVWLMEGDDVGELIDSSTHQNYNPPFYKGNLVPGLQEGLWSMREGGRRQVFLPSETALGEKGLLPAIPPNSDMLYEVGLVEVRNPVKLVPVVGIPSKTTKAGVKYWDLTVGTGEEVLPRADVKVRYTGWLDDGTVFDSTEIMRLPKSFSLARSNVIAGWRDGIRGMRIGGKRRLVVPPSLAYGEASYGKIPPNATLTYDVQVVDSSNASPLPMPSEVKGIAPVTTESGLTYWDIRKGSGSEPAEESQVKIHYSMWLSDGAVVQTTKNTGNAANLLLNRLNAGMREGISTMRVGGVRRMRVPPELAYGEKGFPPEIPPNATLTIEVELFEFK